MVEIKASKCRCGKCGKEFLVEWDLEVVSVSEHAMGERVVYEGQIEYICSECGSCISGTLYVSEYPVGSLEYAEVSKVEDSENTGRSYIEKPIVVFLIYRKRDTTKSCNQKNYIKFLGVNMGFSKQQTNHFT